MVITNRWNSRGWKNPKDNWTIHVTNMKSTRQALSITLKKANAWDLLLFFHLPIIYSCQAIFNFICHLLTIYLSLITILLLLLLLFYCHCCYYYYYYLFIFFDNITAIVIHEKSSGGEFHARNSSGMVYPYSLR